MSGFVQSWKYWVFGWLIQMTVAAVHIVHQPAAQHVELGEDVTLPCIFDAPAPWCYWAMDGDVVDTEGRYLFVGNRTTGNCTLMVQGFQLSDSGSWQCGLPKTDTANAVKSELVNIVPMTYPEVAFLEYPRNVDALPGQSVTLSCSFDAKASSCYWLKEGHVKMLRKNSKHHRHVYVGEEASGDCALTIANVSLEDNGLWQCVYENVTSNFALLSPFAQLTVLVPSKRPYISVNGTALDSRSNLFISSMVDVTRITCLAEDGNPKAHLYWELGGQRLNGSSKNYVTNAAVPMLRTTETELMDSIDPTWQYQTLSCVSTHPASASTRDTAHAFILLPEPTTTASVHVRGSDELTVETRIGEEVGIECRANGVPMPKYKWLRRQRGTGKWLWFHNGQNVTFDALDGEYACLAWNDLTKDNATWSRSSISIIVFVETTHVDVWFQETKLENPEVKIENRKNTTLRCLANGHPGPALRWEVWRDDHWKPVQDGHSITLPSRKEKYSCLAWNMKGSNATVRSMDIFVSKNEIYLVEKERFVPPTTVLVGAVVACVALLAAVSAVAIFCQKRKGSASIEELSYQPNPKVTFY